MMNDKKVDGLMTERRNTMYLQLCDQFGIKAGDSPRCVYKPTNPGDIYHPEDSEIITNGTNDYAKPLSMKIEDPDAKTKRKLVRLIRENK